MEITLIRHFKVDFQWDFVYNSEGFAKACSIYNSSNVIVENLKMDTDKTIISSSMQRAIDTTHLIFSKPPNIVSKLLIEVPIKPFIQTNLKLPAIFWLLIGRIQWRLNSRKQLETYIESNLRVNSLLDAIINKHEDCIIVAHGWIIKIIIKRLIKDNFRGTSPMRIRTGIPYTFSL
ncbi:MAG: histidine phosphatase family protein [Bacteroidales bacterium]|nr:histidine phosphatase family protein [Bacteroidales bacterium]